MKRPSLVASTYLTNNKVSFYPNPADNVLNFNISTELAQKVDIRVYDMSARTVLVDPYAFQMLQKAVKMDISRLWS